MFDVYYSVYTFSNCIVYNHTPHACSIHDWIIANSCYGKKDRKCDMFGHTTPDLYPRSSVREGLQGEPRTLIPITPPPPKQEKRVLCTKNLGSWDPINKLEGSRFLACQHALGAHNGLELVLTQSVADPPPPNAMSTYIEVPPPGHKQF